LAMIQTKTASLPGILLHTSTTDAEIPATLVRRRMPPHRRSSPDFHQILVRLSDLGATNQSGKESIHFFSIMDRILAVKGGKDGDIRSRSTSFSGRFGDFSDRDVGSLKFKPATAGNHAPESKLPKAPLQAARYCRRLRVGRKRPANRIYQN
jgi:hypothetical protein